MKTYNQNFTELHLYQLNIHVFVLGMKELTI